jgi:biotin transport system substrate-specific component
MTQTVSAPTSRDVSLFGQIEAATLMTKLLLALLGTVLLTLSAKTQVPFWPVPMTMQTFVVLLIGFSYGARLGGATVLFYLCEGAIGLPVFAGTPERGLGLAYMSGPTGGYLAGFFIAAVLVGGLAEHGWRHGIWRIAAAMCLGHLVILAAGGAWLAAFVGWLQAWQLGVYPFVLATVAKTMLAVACVAALRRLPNPSTRSSPFRQHRDHGV